MNYPKMRKCGRFIKLYKGRAKGNLLGYLYPLTLVLYGAEFGSATRGLLTVDLAGDVVAVCD